MLTKKVLFRVNPSRIYFSLSLAAEPKKKKINYSQSPKSLAVATREQCSTNDFFELFWFNSKKAASELSQEPFVRFVCQHYTAFIFSSLKSDCLKPNTVIIYLHIAQKEAVLAVSYAIQISASDCGLHFPH